MQLFLLQVKESFFIALQSIRANKLRSLLTTLGIVIGIVSVTCMNMLMSGIDGAFKQSLAMIGSDVLYVDKFPWFTNGDDWWSFRNRPNLLEDYVQPLQEQSKYAAYVTPSAFGNGEIRQGENNIGSVFVAGVSENHLKISNLDLSNGRFITDIENAGARNVIVLGAETATSLFPNEDPIGKRIILKSQPYTVIGVMAKQGKFLGLFSMDNQVMIPISTFKKFFGLRRGIRINIKLIAPQYVEEGKDEITFLMRKLRKLDATEDDNFSINQQEAFKQQLDGISFVIAGVGLFITSLSLIVGMIGVMNIMFVSIKERTREIGVRKALGATRKVILTQFLIEAMTISLIGGLIGLTLSAFLKPLIDNFIIAELPLGVIMVAIGLSLFVGLIAGFLPANSAAKQDPIEALRYE